MSNEDLKNVTVRTDIAAETYEMLKERGTNYSDGAETETKKYETFNVTKVVIKNERAAETFGKPIGTYITIETDKMKINDVSCHEKIIEAAAENLAGLIKLTPKDTVLVVGLGNWNITPDALGPKVVSKILVTRHIETEVPEELGDVVRPVAAVSPGVMGITGIETAEVVKGLVERVKPSLIIAIDALAARKFSRINATIQMTDTGISPGSGVGNKRVSLDRNTLGVPVIGIGVPTVVDAATLVNDTMDRIINGMAQAAKDTHKGFYNTLLELGEEEKYGLIRELLEPYEENMFVTPKEVDSVISRLSGIIANFINITLQPNMTVEDINRYINV